MIAINENWRRADFLVSRATNIICHAKDVERVRALVQNSGLADGIEVNECPYLPPGHIYVVDRTVLDKLSMLAWGPMADEPIPDLLDGDEIGRG